MSADREFFDAALRARVASAIKAVEAQTSAELVVAVRKMAGRYGYADYRCGALAALAMLALLLFHPHVFLIYAIPLDVAGAFALGALLSSRSPWLRRRFSGRRERAEAVGQAAKAAFVDLGISRTRGRTGILVFAAMLERSVEVVADVGVERARLGPAWDGALAALQAALAADPPVAESFVAGLRALAAPLAVALPRAADDVNELPDEVDAS